MSEDAGTRIVFLTTEGMLKVYQRLGMPPGNLCTYCIGGPHPFLRAGFPDAAPARRDETVAAGG